MNRETKEISTSFRIVIYEIITILANNCNIYPVSTKKRLLFNQILLLYLIVPFKNKIIGSAMYKKLKSFSSVKHLTIQVQTMIKQMPYLAPLAGERSEMKTGGWLATDLAHLIHLQL